MSEFENQNTPITYLVWVLLGINAIKDAYLWMDAPDCFFFKNDFVQWNHDITSSLRKENGRHRILSTIADADNVVDNRNNKFVETLTSMAEKDFVRMCFVSSMPMAQVLWSDYDGVIQEVVEKVNKPIFHIPSRSMTDCWLEGYSDLLFSLAKNINIDSAAPQKNNVAIVGNLFDRWEWDCIWNVKELKRIFEALWLNVVSVWLDGWSFDDILKIKDAQTIISLPYGRKAAKKIAKRLKVDVLELDIPFWLDKTGEFITKVWEKFGLEKQAEQFIQQELTHTNHIDILKWVVPHTFIWKRVSFYADPYIINGMMNLAHTLWFQVDKIYIHGDEKHLKNNLWLNLENVQIDYGLNGRESLDHLDLLVRNSHHFLWDRGNLKQMEFGFPSYNYHVYPHEGYFGYKGALRFINRMANILND